MAMARSPRRFAHGAAQPPVLGGWCCPVPISNASAEPVGLVDPGEEPGEPLYLEKYRIRSGEQTIA